MKDYSARILSIRAKAGNDCAVCPVCGHKPYAPFRSYDRSGRIIAGCVDACHTGRLTPISECSRWHSRKEAVAMRRAELEAIR